jgi:hypothetical protein
MVELIWNFCGEFENGSMHLDSADNLLTEMEEAGMTPVYKTGRFQTNHDAPNTEILLYEWEPEDFCLDKHIKNVKEIKEKIGDILEE